MKDKEKNASDVAYQEFLKESAGLSVDVSGLTSIRDRQRAEKKRKPEPKFAQPYSAGYSPKRNALPRALARMANEISENARDPYRDEVIRSLGTSSASEGTGVSYFRESGTGEDIAIDIQRTHDGNWCASYDGKRHVAADRDTLLAGISRAINNNRRSLTDDQKREICLICTASEDGFYRGVAKYVGGITGIPESETMSDSALLDSRNAKAYDEAVAFCWLAIRPDFSPGDDWDDFVRDYARGRSLNIFVLDGARSQYEKRSEAAAREALLSTIDEQPEAPTYRELDQLGDGELASQLNSVRREHARLVKAGKRFLSLVFLILLACLGAHGQVVNPTPPSGGTNTYTTNQVASMADNGKVVAMNCSSACTYTLPAAQPSTTWHADVTSIGSSVATIVLGGSDTFNGSATAPSLSMGHLLPIYANSAISTDYVGDAWSASVGTTGGYITGYFSTLVYGGSQLVIASQSALSCPSLTTPPYIGGLCIIGPDSLPQIYNANASTWRDPCTLDGGTFTRGDLLAVGTNSPDSTDSGIPDTAAGFNTVIKGLPNYTAGYV